MLCNCFVFNEGGLHWTLRKSAQCCVFLTWVLLCSRLLTHLLPLLLDTVSSSTIWCKALTSPAVIYKSEQTVNSILLVSFIRIRGHLWMHVLVIFFLSLSPSLLHLCFPGGQLGDMHSVVWQIFALYSLNAGIYWVCQVDSWVLWMMNAPFI